MSLAINYRLIWLALAQVSIVILVVQSEEEHGHCSREGGEREFFTPCIDLILADTIAALRFALILDLGKYCIDKFSSWLIGRSDFLINYIFLSTTIGQGQYFLATISEWSTDNYCMLRPSYMYDVSELLVTRLITRRAMTCRAVTCRTITQMAPVLIYWRSCMIDWSG